MKRNEVNPKLKLWLGKISCRGQILTPTPVRLYYDKVFGNYWASRGPGDHAEGYDEPGLFKGPFGRYTALVARDPNDVIAWLKTDGKHVPAPEVGDIIYVQTAMYIDHGEDDVLGGRATVSKVEKRDGYTWVSVKEHPGRGYNWDSLAQDQLKLRSEFRNGRARPDPDYG